MPRSSSSQAKNSGVLPSFESELAFSLIVSSTLIWLEINLRLPPIIFLSPAFAANPLPASALNSSVSKLSTSASCA